MVVVKNVAMNHASLVKTSSIVADFEGRQRGENKSCCFDALHGNFDFGDTFEREKQLDEILLRRRGSLLDHVADGIGDGGMEEDAADLESREIYANGLTWGEHNVSPEPNQRMVLG